MKKLLFAFLLLPSFAWSQALPIYLPRTNGQAWNSTFIAPGFSGTALTVNSNMLMGIQGQINWAATVASIRVAHDIHGANRDVLSLDGGPDIVISQAEIGNGGGAIQIGNHSLYGGDAFLAYASSGPSANDEGHSLPLGFEARFNTGSGVTFSKFQLIGRPGTNVVSDGWCNGYLEGWDVPASWLNTPFSRLPNAEAGRRLFKWGREGLFLDAGGFQGMAFTNTGAAGTAVTSWTTGTGSPEGAVTASIGSIFSRVNGGAATTLYVKESGTGNTGWVAVGGGGDSLWTLDATGGPGSVPILVPDENVIGPAVGSMSSFKVYGDNIATLQGETQVQIINGADTVLDVAGGVLTVGNVTTINLDATSVKLPQLAAASQENVAYIAADGQVNRADGSSQPNYMVFPISTSTIDLKTAGDTLALSVAGKSFVFVSAKVRFTFVEAPADTATIKIKCTEGDITAATALTGPVNGNYATILPLALTAKVAFSGSEVEVEVTDNASGDAVDCIVEILGYYIPE